MTDAERVIAEAGRMVARETAAAIIAGLRLMAKVDAMRVLSGGAALEVAAATFEENLRNDPVLGER